MEETSYMGEKEVQRKLLEILMDVVNDGDNGLSVIPELESNELIPIYRLAKKHDLAHLVSAFVYKNKK